MENFPAKSLKKSVFSMYKWGTYFLLEKSVAIFLKLAENENFNTIASLWEERIRMKRFSLPPSFPSPFSEIRNSELLLPQRQNFKKGKIKIRGEWGTVRLWGELFAGENRSRNAGSYQLLGCWSMEGSCGQYFMSGKGNWSWASWLSWAIHGILSLNACLLFP